MTRLFSNVGLRLFSFEVVRLGSQAYQPSFLAFYQHTSFQLKCVVHCEFKRNFVSNSDKFTTEKRLATLDSFGESEEKTKDSFLDLLHFYVAREKNRRGHVEFIYEALKHMKEFGVHKDLEVYKALMEVMPKGKFVARTFWQSEFQHYPKQQQCIIDLLEQMELNRVCPDEEMEEMLINIFGRRSHAIRRLWRMLYWMPKLRNLSPWLVPDPLPDSNLELAKLAIERITSVDPSTKISIFESKDVKEAIDHTWIVSGQSPLQQQLIEEHNETQPLYVEGSFRVWLREASVNYFILRADPDPEPPPQQDIDDVSNLSVPLFSTPSERGVAKSEVVHKQADGKIIAVCATGSSSRDSLLSWVRLLQRENPRLGKIPVLFTLKSPIGPTEPLKEITAEDEKFGPGDSNRDPLSDSGVRGKL